MKKPIYTWALVCVMTLASIAGVQAINYSEMGFNSLKAIGPSNTQIDLWDAVNGGIKVACQNSTCGGGGGGAATIADGADVTQGALADAANTTGAAGTLSGKLRGMLQNQVTAQTSLSSIDTKLTSQATAANQSTGNSSLASILAKIAAFGTAGTPSADVLSVQGRTGMTPIKTDPNITVTVTAIASGVTTNTTSSVVAGVPGRKQFKGNVQGTGAVTQTQQIYGNDANSTTGGILLCTLTLSGTTRADDSCPVITSPWAFHYVTTTSTTGTSASGTVNMQY